MKPNYTYINSPDYINSLSFDHMTTWSFQRGEAYQQHMSLLQEEYNKMKARRERSGSLPAGEEMRYNELQTLIGFTQYLIDDRREFHPSARKTNTFSGDHAVVGRLKQLLQTEVEDVPRWMCAHVYRDAIVFHDKDGGILSALNVCLSCQYMETKAFAHVNGDYKTYDLLKRFFLDIGHEVEDPEYSIVAQMEKLKQQYRYKA